MFSVMTVILADFVKVYFVTRKGERNNGVYGVSKESKNLLESNQKFAYSFNSFTNIYPGGIDNISRLVLLEINFKVNWLSVDYSPYA